MVEPQVRRWQKRLCAGRRTETGRDTTLPGNHLPEDVPSADRPHGPIDGDLQESISKGTVQRVQARVDISVRIQDILRIHAAHQGQAELPG